MLTLTLFVYAVVVFFICLLYLWISIERSRT